MKTGKRGRPKNTSGKKDFAKIVMDQEINEKLKEAIVKSDNVIKRKLDKPLHEMTEDEIIFMDKDVQKYLSVIDKTFIGKVRRARIMDYMIKVETGELDWKKSDIAKAVNITPVSLSIFINDPVFQRDFRAQCQTIVEAMQHDRVSACRKIAMNGLNELLRRTSNQYINRMSEKTLIDMMGFANELMRQELGQDVKVTKVIQEQNINQQVEIKENINDKNFRKGLTDLIKTNVTVLDGGKKLAE